MKIKLLLLTMMIGVMVKTALAQQIKVDLHIKFIKNEAPPQKIFLTVSTPANDKAINDSITVIGGEARYGFEASDISKVTFYDHNSKGNPDQWASFYVSEGLVNVEIQGHLPSIKVSSSAIQDQFKEYWSFVNKEQIAFDSINVRYGRAYKNKPLLDSIRPSRGKARKELDSVNRLFVSKNPDNWFSLKILSDAAYDFSVSGVNKPDNHHIYLTLKNLFNNLSARLRKSPFGQKATARMEGAGAALIGNQIVDFKLPEKNGGIIDTKDFRGKVYLIDFWGSWCVWCRKGHPHLKELYAKYRPKGFEIIAVAVEFGERNTHKDKWLKAIEEDGITWKHVLNDNEVINLPERYGINAYPTKLLVDQNGRIILRITDDEERKLDAKLAELFGS